MTPKEKFDRFLTDLGVLFCGWHFDEEEKRQIMAIVSPSFVAKCKSEKGIPREEFNRIHDNMKMNMIVANKKEIGLLNMKLADLGEVMNKISRVVYKGDEIGKR